MTWDRDLAAFQESFLDAVRQNTTPTGLRHAGGLDVTRRFRLYANQTRVAQADALQAVYPAVCRLVGEAFFANMAALYVEAHPLRHGDLRRYGESLPDFIQAFPPLAGLPYLPHVARLEWACHEALHAGGGAAAEAGQVLQLAPHVRLVQAPFPIADIWDFALREHAPDERLDLSSASDSHLVIARPVDDVEIMQVPAPDWTWLSGFVVAQAAGADTDLPARAYWLERGILSGVR